MVASDIQNFSEGRTKARAYFCYLFSKNIPNRLPSLSQEMVIPRLVKIKADLALRYAKRNNKTFIKYSPKLKLEEKFWRVEIKPAKIKGRLFYKVLIYLTDNFYQAVKLAEELKKEFKEGFLVAE